MHTYIHTHIHMYTYTTHTHTHTHTHTYTKPHIANAMVVNFQKVSQFPATYMIFSW